MVEFLTGKDYPHLCKKCQDAIDTAVIYFREGAPDTDDPEAPCDYAYDHGWLCSSRGYDGCEGD